jgi:hypothetical protein
MNRLSEFCTMGQHVHSVCTLPDAKCPHCGLRLQADLGRSAGICPVDRVGYINSSGDQYFGLSFSKSVYQMTVGSRCNKSNLGTFCWVSEVREKIAWLSMPRLMSYRPALIHTGANTEIIAEHEYFSSVIDFGDLMAAHTSRHMKPESLHSRQYAGSRKLAVPRRRFHSFARYCFYGDFLMAEREG